MSTAEAAPFVFPRIRKGQTVRFMKSPSDETSQPFLVTEVHDETLEGLVIWPQGLLEPRDSVRHISDPWLRDERKVANMLDDDEGGVFVEDPYDVELRDQLQGYETQLESLTDVVQSQAEALTTLVGLVAKLDPEAAKQVAVEAPRRRGRPRKEKADETETPAAPATEVKLSNLIGGGSSPQKIDAAQKASVIAGAR